MAKKYLTLQEAAEQLGMTAKELEQQREDGVIRGFANRGSWKFREDDVAEFARSRETDSSPEIPLADLTGEKEDENIAERLSETDSDSDVQLFSDSSLFDEDDDPDDLATSDSDVRLAGDSGPMTEPAEGDENVLAFSASDNTSNSDSDVQLVDVGTDPDIDLSSTSPEDKALDPGDDSDSGVKLSATGFAEELSDLSADSDSDVHITAAEGEESGILLTDSDSDIRLTSDDADSDSEVSLVHSESDAAAGDTAGEINVGQQTGDQTEPDMSLLGDQPDLRLSDSDASAGELGSTTVALPDDSDLKLIDPLDDDTDDSGITISTEDDSGISLDIDDSGISLQANDSGISLEGVDSGFADDSGITLDAVDSGISLDAGDSGISLDAADSGIALHADQDSGISLQDDAGRPVQVGVLGGQGADSGAETMQMDTTDAAVVEPGVMTGDFDLGLLDSEEEDTGTDTSIMMFDDEDGDAEAGFDDEDDFGEDFADDFDDSEMDDVFDAEDQAAFDDDGESSGVFVPPPGTTTAAVEAPWGNMVTAGVAFGSIVSALGAVAGFELIRTMWLWSQPGSEPSGILTMIGGFFV